MRARLALVYSGVQCELREVVLKHKPLELLQVSPKGTVPVLLLADGAVVDESRDIMVWALQQHDPHHWLDSAEHPLVAMNDTLFKPCLDRYKYADRFPEHPQSYYRAQCLPFLRQVDAFLETSGFDASQPTSFVEAALLPFIRQWNMVEPSWFPDDILHVQAWLRAQLDGALLARIMEKYPAWQAGDDARLLMNEI